VAGFSGVRRRVRTKLGLGEVSLGWEERVGEGEEGGEGGEVR
jgi:hypothetical protein